MHPLLDDIDGDDEEPTRVANFCDDFSGSAVEGPALDDVLRFAGAAIALSFDDLACEDDVFEVKDREVVIFKFIRSVGGHNVTERPDQLAKVGDGHLSHAQVYGVSSPKAACSGGSAPIELPAGIRIRLQRQPRVCRFLRPNV